MNNSRIILVCLVLTVACSKVKKFDKRTKNMENSTEKVATVTQELNEITTILYQQVRSAESLKIRNRAYELLLEKESGMRTKVTAASMYVRGFEYQLWTGVDTFDNFMIRSNLLTDAANEFINRVGDLYALIETKKMSPLNQGPNYNNEMAFYAMAVSVHMNSHLQAELVEKKSLIETFSLYDIMSNALFKDLLNYDLEEYEIVFVNGLSKEITIELFKARVDIMATLAVANMTDKRKMTLNQVATNFLFQHTKGKIGTFDLPEIFEDSNDTTNNFTKAYLDIAVKTKKFLKTIGIEKKIQRSVKSVLRNIQLKDSKKNSLHVQGEDIRSLINELLE